MAPSPQHAALVLRTGFPGERDPAALRWDVPPATVHLHRLATPWRETRGNIAALAAPFIILADSIALPEIVRIHKALQLLERINDCAAITLQSPALGSVLGMESPAMAAGVQQRITRLPWAPSWFCVARHAALAEAGFFSSPHASLEFSLMAASEAWRRTGKAIVRLDAQSLDFDTVAWARAVLSQTAPPLAEDYAHWMTAPHDIPAPAQFRVAFQGYHAADAPPRAAFPPEPAGNGPMFSLLCPAYKAAFFHEMLDSVRAQSWPDWELLVRVDGPPEPDRERILRALESVRDDARVRVQLQENSGTGVTRARLAAEARGRFLMCIDDDDLLPPNTLLRFAQTAAAHPGAALIRGGTRLFGLVEQYLRPRPRMTINGMSCDLFEVNQPFAIRRDLHERLGGFQGDADFGGAGEDTEFFLRMEDTGVGAVVIDEPLYLRRISTHNQSLLYTGDQFNAHLRNLVRAHAPAGWRLEETHFQEWGAYVAQTLTLASLADPARIHCPTTYFNYYTVGASAHAVLDLEVTSRCNARCVFCPRDALHRGATHIDFSLVERIAAELKDAPRRRVVLCGVGEPLLHPRILDIVERLSAAGAEVCMTTNGAALTPAQFLHLEARGLAQLNVSLNALSESTHAALMKTAPLTQITAAIDGILEDVRARKSPVEINVSFVLCDANQHELDDFIARWRDAGVAQIFIHPLNNRAGLLTGRVTPCDPAPAARAYARDPRVVVDLFDQPRENEGICTIAQGIDFITVDGRVPLCVLDYEERHVIGNITHEPFQRLHLNKIAQYRRGVFSALCAGCSFSPTSSREGSG